MQGYDTLQVAITSDGFHCYEFNEANQMKKVKSCDNNQTMAEYVYDFNGNRMVKKTYTNGTLKDTTTSWSDSYETKVINGGGTESTAYYFANNELIAKKNPDGSKTYFHNDHLGSTTVITNQSGNIVEKTEYDPWGEVKDGGTKSKFQYTGQEKDLETGLNYYNYRYYDSHIRRFTQPDDIIQDAYNPQDLNRYSYVRNNPLKYTDPTGHVSLLPAILAGGVINGVASASMLYLENPNLPAQDYLIEGGKGIGIGMITTGATLGLGAPISAGLTKTGASLATRTVATDMIAGGLVNSFQSIANNWNTVNPYKNVPQAFINGSITSGIAGAIASKIIPQTPGRPSEKLSIGFTGPKSILSTQRIATSQFVERLTLPYVSAVYLSVGGKTQPSKAQSKPAPKIKFTKYL